MKMENDLDEDIMWEIDMVRGSPFVNASGSFLLSVAW
jgi:hypothetical protein